MADIGLKNTLVYNPHGWSFNMKESKRLKLKLYELIEKMLSPLQKRLLPENGLPETNANKS